MLPPDEERPVSQVALSSINTAVVDEASVEPDDCTTNEAYDLARKNAELASFRQDTGERKRYAKNIFSLTCLWVGGIYFLLLLQGFNYGGFFLSDPVVIAAIGSTTANIIGVFLIVTRYFFPKKRG